MIDNFKDTYPKFFKNTFLFINIFSVLLVYEILTSWNHCLYVLILLYYVQQQLDNVALADITSYYFFSGRFIQNLTLSLKLTPVSLKLVSKNGQSNYRCCDIKEQWFADLDYFLIDYFQFKTLVPTLNNILKIVVLKPVWVTFIMSLYLYDQEHSEHWLHFIPAKFQHIKRLRSICSW